MEDKVLLRLNQRVLALGSASSSGLVGMRASRSDGSAGEAVTLEGREERKTGH